MNVVIHRCVHLPRGFVLLVLGMALALDAAGVCLDNAGWRVRDVSAGAGFLGARDAEASAQLRLAESREDLAAGTCARCTVEDLRRGERAVTLAYRIPLDAVGWRWWDTPNASRAIEAGGAYSNIVEGYFGYAYMGSQYPLAVLSNASEGICLAVPLEPPRAVRLLYDAGAREFRAEFDFGLSPIPEHFPSTADAAVWVYTTPARWAFREALERYYGLHPGVFDRRAGRGGTFLTKSPLERIERPEDFCFAWHDFPAEYLEMAAQDRALGVQSFVYREPQTNWRELRGDAPRTYASYMAQLKEDAEKGDARAQGTLVGAVEGADGRLDLYLDSIAWTKNAPFGVNADPEICVEGQGAWPNKGRYELEDLGRALGWDGGPATFQGVFYDSMEGWTNLLNYRHGHWRTSRYPLTFDRNHGNRVCLSNLWGNYAFAKELAARLRAHGQLLMGNGAFHFLWMFAPFVDIPGREYSWYEAGRWTPVPDERFLFLRAMAYRKPCWLLMNDPFDDASHLEAYFQRCLFYGVFPSMFHAHTGTSAAYFWDPKYPNRDRHLFMKYVPLVRMLDEAGWAPVPYAAAEPDGACIERYGDFARGTLAFTVHNAGSEAREVTLRLQRDALGVSGAAVCSERISESVLPSENVGDEVLVHVPVESDGYAMITIRAKAA